MSKYHHRAPARGESGYLCWSVMNGTATLQMPWSDVIPSGRVDMGHLSTVYTALHKFEEHLLEREHDDETMPALPTPNAKIMYLDNAAFNTELATRLTAYKDKLQRAVSTRD
jgi:hypothetical protein